MRSWIFRHRLRLRVLYGPRPEPVEPLARASERAARRARGGLRPGEWERRKRDVWIRPRPPPAA